MLVGCHSGDSAVPPREDGASVAPLPLDRPPRGVGIAGVLLDLSHGQQGWGEESIFGPAVGPLAKAAGRAGRTTVHLRAVDSAGRLLSPRLGEWSGLVVGPPRHDSITREVEDSIVQWVKRGGRLLILSGSETSGQNDGLNRLVGRFGLHFRDSVIFHPNALLSG